MLNFNLIKFQTTASSGKLRFIISLSFLIAKLSSCTTFEMITLHSTMRYPERIEAKRWFTTLNSSPMTFSMSSKSDYQKAATHGKWTQLFGVCCSRPFFKPEHWMPRKNTTVGVVRLWMRHIVWKLLKMSHLDILNFENGLFLAFLMKFCSLKM